MKTDFQRPLLVSTANDSEEGRAAVDQRSSGVSQSALATRSRKPQRTPGRKLHALDETSKALIYERYRGGASLVTLAKRFGRSERSIRRVIRRLQAQGIRELPLEYVPSPAFTSPDARQEILGPLPDSARSRRQSRPQSGLPPYLASLYEVPLLTGAQEKHLFRRYNYLKFLAADRRARIDWKRPAKREMDEIERLYDEAVAAKNQIIQANLRLVVSIAKLYLSDVDTLFELISDGNQSLMRAVEKFDYTRGFKFSTYASWAIKKNFMSSYAREMKYRERFRTGPDELLDREPQHRTDPQQQLRAQRTREAQVGKILGSLPDRERHIIVGRFGLTQGQEPKTLQKIADELGVSKERIRQLERRAMHLLREAAFAENIEIAA